MDEARLLRIQEVAELLSLSRTKVYELVASRRIPSIQVGRSRRVPLAALRVWISEQVELATPRPDPLQRHDRLRQAVRADRARLGR